MACYLVTPQDREVAKYTNGWDGADVARLRGMSEEFGKKIDLSNPIEAAKKLAEFRRELLSKSIRKSSTNMAKSFRELRDTMSAEIRYNRVRMIATLFSAFLDKYQQQYPMLRSQLANNHNSPVSQMDLFDNIYKYLQQAYTQYVAKNDEYRANEIKKVLDNYGALCAYARIMIKHTEGIKLGNNLDYAADATPDNFDDNALADLFNAEEETRESWQEKDSMSSAFGSLGAAVRRVLSTIQAVDDKGMQVRDDLGTPMFINPMVAHQSVMDAVLGMQSESDMLAKLSKSSLPYKAQLIRVLQNNPQVRTQFFVDMYKNFQKYSEVSYEKGENGVVKVKTYIKNRLRNLLGGSYAVRITLGKTLSNHSVYDNNGKINWANVKWVMDYLRKNFTADKTNNAFARSQYETATPTKKAQMLVEISTALGIDLDEATARKIAEGKVKKVAGRKNYVTNLTELLSQLDQILSKEDKEALENGNYGAIKIKSQKFKDLFKFKTQSAVNMGSKQGNIEEKINKMLDIVAQERESFRIESRVSRKDRNGKTNSMYSYVKPSYMGSLLERINAYAQEKNRDGLRQFLEGKFLDSSMFRLKDGRILNRWIADLYDDAFDGKAFSELLTYDRFLGSEDTNFEDFTSKQHAIQMINAYFFGQNLTDSKGRKYANYPVFILGDSGVCKYIRAKRYSQDDILDGLYNIYLSECQRNLLVTAANNKLTSDGYRKLDNIKEEGFKMLPFLEDKNYRPQGEPSSWTESDVKAAIKKYMDDAVVAFKRNITALGVLEKSDKGKYIWLGQVADKEFKGDMDALLADYFWNTKFATLQQFQMMTIDVAYYKNTKDLQKRYKEIHAPGDAISVEALDFDNVLYSEDGIETCVYFDDPQINAETSNPAFMGAILYQYTPVDRKDEALKAIKEGILTPQEDSEKEEKRVARIKDLLGSNYSTYKAYTSNALADGQGYRTIDSYRKVMGMAGQWTREMESAYKKIKALRAQYGEDGVIPANILQEIADLAITFQPIKPYMFTIENYDMGGNGKVLKVPVQHKYAEAILIPELLPKGSMLRHMALWMENNNVDLVGSNTTVKVGAFGVTSLDDAIQSGKQEDLLAALERGYKHKLNYADYRIQTNVPEHANSSQLFGTQVRKLIMAGIKMRGKNYSSYIGGQPVNICGQLITGPLEGLNLVNFYNSLIVANILSSFHEFENEVSDANTLSQILQQTVINNDRESLDNLFAFGLENGTFHMPLFEGGIEHDTSAMLMSLFKKKVNKQRIKGGSGVQVSAMGIKGYEESGDLHYVTSADGTNILYAEVEVPWDLSIQVPEVAKTEKGEIIRDKDMQPKYTYRTVALRFEDYCNADGTLIMDSNGKTKIENQFPGILDRICYRIPTESDYSMINVKIKRFSQKTAGATIKVPAQGTTIAGFDFDIDKLYFMMRDFYVKREALEAQSIMKQLEEIFTNAEIPSQFAETLELEEYDLSKDALNQDVPSTVATALRNNMLISLISQRLQDPETFTQRTTPGGFADHSRAARIMRELQYGSLDGIVSQNGEIDFSKLTARAKDKKSDPEPNYDPSDPFTIITYNQMNQVAGKLIGIFANQNTNHAFASLMSEFKLRTPIAICGHNEGFDDLLHAPEGTNPSLNVAECLAASVDAVKDPVLNYLNFNTVTADAGALLARLGYTGEEIGIFLNQPIIRELCEGVFNNNTTAEKMLDVLEQKYLKQLGNNIEDIEVTPELFSMQKLAQAIIQDRKQKEAAVSEEDYKWSNEKAEYQLAVLKQFREILATAQEVSTFVTSTKFTASNAVGSSFGAMYAQQSKVAKYIESMGKYINGVFKPNQRTRVMIKVAEGIFTPISNSTNLTATDEEYMRAVIANGLGNPFAYEQAMFDMNRRAIKLLNKYFPYDTQLYSQLRNEATQLSRYGTLDEDLINELHRAVLVHVLSHREGDFEGDKLITYKNTEMTLSDYYTKEFPKQIAQLLEEQPELKHLAILRYMIVDEGKDDTIELKIQDVGGLSPQQKDEIRDSWAELALNYKDESNSDATINLLARGLFLYCFYKSGFEFSPKSFMHLAPVALKDHIIVDNEGTTYTDLLKKLLEGKIQFDHKEFLARFIAEHSKSSRFTYKTHKGSAESELDKLLKQKMSIHPEGFTVTKKELDNLKNSQLYIMGAISNPRDHVQEWIPAVLIGNALYMTSQNGAFNNVSYSDEMDYLWVGTVDSDGTFHPRQDKKDIDASQQVEAVEPVGNTDVQDDAPIQNVEPAQTLQQRDLKEIAKAVATRMVAEDSDRDYQETVKAILETLEAASEDEFNAFIEDVKNAYGELHDSLGNKIC